MSNLVLSTEMTAAAIEHVLLRGDLSKLNEKERLNYYMNVCQTTGLNHLTRPFEYIVLNGRLTLYARKDAADQLRKLHGVSIAITEAKKIDDIYIVSVSARDKSGREDAATGAVNVANLKGEALANAFLKAETKAKRRVTLSISGLGMLDESEIEEAQRTEIKANEVREVVASTATTMLEHDSMGDYLVTFGEFADKTLKEVPVSELEKYVQKCERAAEKSKKKIEGRGLELMTAIKAYLEEVSTTQVHKAVSS